MNVGIGKAFTGVFIASLALVVGLVFGVRHEVVPAGTFHTEDLVVDNDSLTKTLHIDTSGQSVLFSTLKAASSDGLNIFIGGGGQLGVVNALGTYTASRNISLGNDALLSNVDGYDNVAIGDDALKNNIGINAGLGPSQGHDNVAIGDHALETNRIGETNIAIGGNALKMNDLSRNSIAIGYNALAANTAQENIAIGTNSSLLLVTGTQNITIGTTFTTATAASNNIVMGHDSMGGCTTGCNDNVAIGVDVLQNTDSIQNVGIGTFALRATTGYNNVGIGVAAGYQATSGHDNTFVGSSTGAGITTGTSNTILGANVSGLSSSLSNNIILADGDGAVRAQFDSSGNATLAAALWAKGIAYLGGSTQGDTVYVSSGSVNFGSGNASTDNLKVNFCGHTGCDQFRDFRVYDGKSSLIGTWTGSTGTLDVLGGITINTNKTTINGTTGTIAVNAGDLAVGGAGHDGLIEAKGSVTGVRMAAAAASWIDPAGADNAMILAIGHQTPSYSLDLRDPGNTHTSTVRLGSFSGTSHFNTTGGATASYSVYGEAVNDRTSGGNDHTNYAGFFDAANGQVNYALYTDRGDVNFNGSSTFGDADADRVTIWGHQNTKGTAPGVSACGTGAPALDGNATDHSGTITFGTVATTCTLTFSIAYTNDPHCTVTAQANALAISYTHTNTALVITGAVLGGGKADYICDGGGS